jgi:hypothetical protein
MFSGRVVPEEKGGAEFRGDGEEDGQKTEEDEPAFVERLGYESYITFAEFAKYMSIFNPKTGLDEKI